MYDIAQISRLSYVFSVTRHQILLVAIVVNLVYTYLTRIQFMYDIAQISRLSYVFFCHVFSVTRHQILLVAIVVNLVCTYLTRIQFMYDIAQISRLSYVFFCYVFFCYQAPNTLGCHSSQFSLHLSHQDSVYV